MAISSALGSSALLPAGLGFRNKIINGDMRIAQRGTGLITGSTSAQYPTDRWVVFNATGTVTFQQSNVAPTGFTNSIVATNSSTPGTYGSSGYTLIGQYIEGFNVADLAYGTSGAKSIAISFWVRASLTGTYSCVLQNSAQNRSYVSTYTILSQNTWEQKIIYISGDTSGTWLTDSNVGLRVWFPLGLGTQWDTITPNTWLGVNAYSTSSTVDFAANASANFYITGVQLEQNYQPTPFEQRPVGAELQLCQRYYRKYTSGLQSGAYGWFGSGWVTTAANSAVGFPWGSAFRTAPSVTFSAADTFYVDRANGNGTATAIAVNASSDSSLRYTVTSNTATGTVGQGVMILQENVDVAFIEASAEL